MVDGFEMHEAVITRGEWGGLPEELIMVRENCVLVHPGGKNSNTCHQLAHTFYGRRTCVWHLFEAEGYEKVMAWLGSLKGVASSHVVKDAVRLVEKSWSEYPVA
jgi:hypothetical protein